MTTRDMLDEMRALLTRAAYLKRDIDRLQRAGAAYSSPKLDGMPKAAAFRPEAEAVAAMIAGEMEELARVEQDMNVFGRRLAPHINALPDTPQRRMLVMRYVYRLSVCDAARAVGYARRHAYRLLAEGEKMLCRA